MTANEETITAEALYATGFALHREQRFEDAAALFRAMLHVAPTDERCWLALGDCHEQVGQLDLALELYGTGAVVADPAPRCWAARARVLAERGEVEGAAEALEEAQLAAEPSWAARRVTS